MVDEINEEKCDQCGATTFRLANDSILQREYSFCERGKLKMCEACGAKYIICKCGALLTRVHLSIDVYGVRDVCPKCGLKNEAISEWIAFGGGRGKKD
ncbi:MAG: hypothetical protein GY870_22215 [archaeon]|nr:hypothetical protein [archaeon]